MKNSEKAKIIHKAYTKAKNKIKIDGKAYYLHFALFRTEKNFRHLMPFKKEDSDEVKIIIDNKSDICLGYASKKLEPARRILR